MLNFITQVTARTGLRVFKKLMPRRAFTPKKKEAGVAGGWVNT
jgi:hypothetical protein